MTQTVVVTRRIRRPIDEVSPFIDPHQIMPLVTGMGRFDYVRSASDGEEWDLFLDVGPVQIGGRVLVLQPDDRRLTWQTIRGTSHSFEAEIEPDGSETILRMRLTYSMAGFATAWLAERVGRGIATRHLEAAAEEIRHHVEFES